MLRTEITKSHLNNHICQHRGMKTSTVTPSFYYVFNISLYCYDTIPNFIGNLWRVLLPGNHLNQRSRRIRNWTIRAAYLGKNLAEKSLLTGIPPRKKTLLQVPAPGSWRESCREAKFRGEKFSPSKNSSIKIPAEKLYILVAETEIPVRVR